MTWEGHVSTRKPRPTGSVERGTVEAYRWGHIDYAELVRRLGHTRVVALGIEPCAPRPPEPAADTLTPEALAFIDELARGAA